jgi:hypothetical protein
MSANARLSFCAMGVDGAARHGSEPRPGLLCTSTTRAVHFVARAHSPGQAPGRTIYA